MDAAQDVCGVRRTIRRRLGLLALGGASFLATILLIGSVTPPPHTPTLRPKVDAFLADKDTYDAVFIGSSRVQRGLRPDVVDAMLSSPGRSFRSFNLGVPGMESFEADVILREILASEPKRLRFVVMEAPRWRALSPDASRRTEREVAWHDARATRGLLRTIWSQPSTILTKLRKTWEHVRLFAIRATGYATGGRAWAEETPYGQRLRRGLAAVRGYLPLDEDMGGRTAARRRRFLAQSKAYAVDVARMRQLAEEGRLVRADLQARYNRPALQTQVDAMLESGIQPVYVVPPLRVPVADYAAMEREGLIPNLIDLRDPRLYPELFDPDNRFDREHMNEDGARLMSALVARRLERLMADAAPKSSD